jgi:hypothetical protein
MKAVQNLLKFIILKERTIWMGVKGGERKQTERLTDRQTDKEKCMSEGNGREKTRERKDAKGTNSEIPYTMHKKCIFLDIYA